MNTVQARKAGAQPMPVRTCPVTRPAKLPAVAVTRAPAMASGNTASTVRREP